MIETFEVAENLQVKIDSFAGLVWIIEKHGNYSNKILLPFDKANKLRELLNSQNEKLNKNK